MISVSIQPERSEEPDNLRRLQSELLTVNEDIEAWLLVLDSGSMTLEFSVDGWNYLIDADRVVDQQHLLDFASSFEVHNS